MGMFDYLIISGDEAKLQAREAGINLIFDDDNNYHGQTKSLKNVMTTYVVQDHAIYERKWIRKLVGDYKEKTILGITADVSEYTRVGQKFRKLPHVKSIVFSAYSIDGGYSRYILTYEESGIKITPYRNNYSELIEEDWIEEYFNTENDPIK